MSIEMIIEANTKALRDLTSAIQQLFKAAASQVPMDTPQETTVEAASEVVALDPISYDQLAAMITKLTKKHGRGKAVELLAEFGAKNLKEIPLEQYAEVARVAQMMIEA